MKPPAATLIACTCGDALRGCLDFERVTGAGGTGPALVVRDFCLPEGRAKAAAWLREAAARRVVVAACGAPMAAAALADVATRVGLDVSRTVLVDVREGCAWVHTRGAQATDKAIRQVRAAAAGLAEAVAAPAPIERTLSDAALIIGRGPAAAAAAARLQALGSKVIVLDPPGSGGPDSSEPGHGGLNAHARVCGTLVSLDGDAGNFQARIEGPDGTADLTVGAVIVAGGPARKAAQPEDLTAVPLSDLEQGLADGTDDALPSEQGVVFIMDDVPWPAVTASTLGVALRLVRDRQCHCLVLFRDLGVAGAGLEERYREARAAGVAFVRLGPSAPETARTADGRWSVRVEIAGVGLMTETADLIVRCTTPGPPDVVGLRQVLGVGSGAGTIGQRMFLEPVFTERAGVFWIGAARAPVTEDQAVRQGEAAAMAAVLAMTPAASARAPAVVDTERCALCLTCLRVCPHHAVTIGPGPAMQVLVSTCLACGVCAAACPAGAIQVVDAPGRRLLVEVDALLDPPPPAGDGGLVIVYACANSAMPAAQALGRLRRSYDERVMLVPVPCLGRVETIHALRPLVAGAARVLICGCFDGSCEHVVGPQRARGVAARASAVAEALGLDPASIEVAAVAPVDWHRLAALLPVAGAVESPGGQGVRPLAADHVAQGAAYGAE